MQSLSPLGACKRRLVRATTVALMVGEMATYFVFTLGALSSQVLKRWPGACRDSISYQSQVGLGVNQVFSCSRREVVY